MRNKLAKCNKCGSDETHVTLWIRGESVISRCFECGTIQQGDLIERKLVPYKCYICDKDITEINEKLIPMWHGIKIDLNKPKYVCNFCYKMWKVNVLNHDNELKEIDRIEKEKIQKEKEEKRRSYLNSMEKEQLIDLIIVTESIQESEKLD